MRCGAQIGGYAGVELTKIGGTFPDRDYDCAECKKCYSLGAGIFAGLIGSAGCAMRVTLKPFKPLTFGWPDIGYFDLGLFAGFAGDAGPECPPGFPLCVYAGGKVALGVQTPQVKVKFGWFGAFHFQCKFGFKGCAEATNCAQCSNNCPSCASFTPNYSCNVGKSI